MSKKPKVDPVLAQLNRIKGQLDGVSKMYEDERPCIEVVRQIIAAKNSLGRIARDLLTNEASRCNHSQSVKELDQILKELFKY